MNRNYMTLADVARRLHVTKGRAKQIRIERRIRPDATYGATMVFHSSRLAEFAPRIRTALPVETGGKK